MKKLLGRFTEALRVKPLGQTVESAASSSETPVHTAAFQPTTSLSGRA
jgi:hypothetical protein